MAINRLEGYTSHWEIIPIDVKTWAGTEKLKGVKSIRIVNDGTAEVPKLQSGSLEVVLPEGERFQTGWYRIIMLLRNYSGQSESIPLATLLFEAEDGENDHHSEVTSVTGQSVLKPVEDAHMMNGEYIGKGTDGAMWCWNMLSRHTPAPVVNDGGSFIVDRYYVFDSGTSYLSAVWKVLDSAGWVLQIHGDGTIHLLPKPKEPKFEIGRADLGIIKDGIKYSRKISEVPNLYYAKLNRQHAQVINDDVDSITSIPYRSYVKDFIDLDPIPMNGETLDHYVNRMLEEQSTVYETYSYTREFWPDFYVFDKVYWNIPKVNTGEMRVLSQSITCTQGIEIEEQSGKELKLWTMS